MCTRNGIDESVLCLTTMNRSRKLWTRSGQMNHYVHDMQINPVRDQLRAMLIHDVAPRFVGTTLEEQRATLDEMGAQMQLPTNLMVARHALAGVPVEVLTPRGAERRVVLHAHGGGFAMGSCASHRAIAGWLGEACRARVILPEFRLAPEHPFPAGLDDLFAVYRALLASGTPAEQIIVTGDSAGGNLAVALTLRAREAGLPLPRALVLLSPWLDLTCSGATMQTRAELDPWLRPEMLGLMRDCYLQGIDSAHPLASPCLADLTGLPPMLMQVGDHEILLSDSERMFERARAAGVKAVLEVQPELWHVWHLMAPMLPEAVEAFERITMFVTEQFGTNAIRIAS
jgi:monoterpene epsilon-lactone hydrolase